MVDGPFKALFLCVCGLMLKARSRKAAMISNPIVNP